MSGEEAGDAGGQGGVVRGRRRHLGGPPAPLGSGHLLEDLLLCRGVGGDGGGEGGGTDHARAEGWTLQIKNLCFKIFQLEMNPMMLT